MPHPTSSLFTVSPPDSNFTPRREFLAEPHRPPSEFALLSIAGASYIRLTSFASNVTESFKIALKKHSLLRAFRQDTHKTCEFSLERKPWTSSKRVEGEKLLVIIFSIILGHGYNFLSTIDYGRDHDDKLCIAFSRPTLVQTNGGPPMPLPAPLGAPFALSFPSATVLRVINPPLRFTPAILQGVRAAWPRGVVSEKKVAEGCYEFKLKGYSWFQEDTFADDSLQYIFALLQTLDSQQFTLFASLSLSVSRSRVKDMWILWGPSQDDFIDTPSNASDTDIPRTLPPIADSFAPPSPPYRTDNAVPNDVYPRRVSTIYEPKSPYTRPPSEAFKSPTPTTHTSIRRKAPPPTSPVLRNSEESLPPETDQEPLSNSVVDMTGIGSGGQSRTSAISRNDEPPHGSRPPSAMGQQDSSVHQSQDSIPSLPSEGSSPQPDPPNPPPLLQERQGDENVPRRWRTSHALPIPPPISDVGSDASSSTMKVPVRSSLPHPPATPQLPNQPPAGFIPYSRETERKSNEQLLPGLQAFRVSGSTERLTEPQLPWITSVPTSSSFPERPGLPTFQTVSVARSVQSEHFPEPDRNEPPRTRWKTQSTTPTVVHLPERERTSFDIERDRREDDQRFGSGVPPYGQSRIPPSTTPPVGQEVTREYNVPPNGVPASIPKRPSTRAHHDAVDSTSYPPNERYQRGGPHHPHEGSSTRPPLSHHQSDQPSRSPPPHDNDTDDRYPSTSKQHFGLPFAVPYPPDMPPYPPQAANRPPFSGRQTDPPPSHPPNLPTGKSGWVLVNVDNSSPVAESNGDARGAGRKSSRNRLNESGSRDGLNTHARSRSGPHPSSMSPLAKAVVAADAKTKNKPSSLSLKGLFSKSKPPDPEPTMPVRLQPRTAKGKPNINYENGYGDHHATKPKPRRGASEASRTYRRVAVE